MKKPTFTDIFFKEFFFEDFYVFNIGHEECQPEHKFGPDMREHYILHYVAEGSGIYRTQNITYKLKKGDFFLIRPGELIEYKADKQTPWTYFWLGFSGSKVLDLLPLNGIGSRDYVGTIQKPAEVLEKLEAMLKMDLFDDQKKLLTQAAFFDLFSYFTIQQNKGTRETMEQKTVKYSESFLLYVQNNYYRSELTIAEIAKTMYLNPAYFSQVIKRELGVTAVDYLKSYRMHKAAFLLTTSDLSIEEIALLVGYQNRHSFTRAFKAAYQCSPSQYTNG